jgi:hypothetical protein
LRFTRTNSMVHYGCEAWRRVGVDTARTAETSDTLYQPAVCYQNSSQSGPLTSQRSTYGSRESEKFVILGSARRMRSPSRPSKVSTSRVASSRQSFTFTCRLEEGRRSPRKTESSVPKSWEASFPPEFWPAVPEAEFESGKAFFKLKNGTRLKVAQFLDNGNPGLRLATRGMHVAGLKRTRSDPS